MFRKPSHKLLLIISNNLKSFRSAKIFLKKNLLSYVNCIELILEQSKDVKKIFHLVL